MPAFNKKEEDRRIEEEAAAATLGTIISIAQARRLVATYPACLPHAGALVAEARQGKRPAGLLIHLIERGWTPPAAAGGPDAPEREACPGCGGDVALCHGIHGRIAYDEVEQGNDDDRR
jgi:hypothetical protein